jgi:hypothetical protein
LGSKGWLGHHPWHIGGGSLVPKGVAETTPNGGFGVVLATLGTHGGGFGHPLGTKGWLGHSLSTLSHPHLARWGLPRPPPRCQGGGRATPWCSRGGYSHPPSSFFFFLSFFLFLFLKNVFFFKEKI